MNVPFLMGAVGVAEVANHCAAFGLWHYWVVIVLMMIGL
mgnify:CR=1 FL=1